MLAAGDQSTIQRNGMAMSLNNGGDTIRLIDAGTGERDRFSYTSSQPGARIETGH